MRKYNVGIVGSAGVPAQYGGFETLVDQLCRNKPKKEISSLVFCSSKDLNQDQQLEKYYSSDLYYLDLSANEFSSIIYDLLSMIISIAKCRNVLILGVSACFFLPLFKPFFNKIVVNIDGLEWKREKWGKGQKLFLRISEFVAIWFANEIVCDNQEIENHVRRIRKSALCRLIAYGGDHIVSKNQKESPRLLADVHSGEYWISVCRIEPENNTAMILEGFSQLNENLVFVGNWQRSEYGKKLFEKYKDNPNITFLNPIYEQRKVDMLRGHAKGYVHGHSAGGTNPSLVEAMHHSLPVFSYDVSYNRYTTNNKAFYFRSSSDLKGMIENISKNELKECANEMFKYAKSNYMWDYIAGRYWRIFQ